MTWSIDENDPIWEEGHGIFTEKKIQFQKYNYLSFIQNCSSFFTGLHPGLTIHGQSALTKSVGYYMLFVILLVLYFCYFIVIEVNRNYHSFKTISPFLIGSNSPANSSKPASVDQIWKKFAISSKTA